MKRKSFLFFWLLCSAIIFFNGAVSAQQTGKRTRGDAAKNSVAKTSSKTASQAVNDESLPRKIDDQTAVSPIYQISSKNCRNRDSRASEGDDFYRECKGYGEYLLRATGSDYRINYGIVAKNPQSDFSVMLFPLGEGAASKYERADLYDEKLSDQIEWRLDEQGRPFAIIIRVSFYKNTGSAKTFSNLKNKRAEFIFVRGLAGFEDLKEDLPTVGTAYNPLEQARAIAAEFLAKHRQ